MNMNKFWLLGLLLLSGVSRAQPLRIAVAANAQFAALQLKTIFEKQTGQKVELVVSSSGKLTTQIQQGGPYDVFLSADTQFPDVLYANGFAVEKPRIYAYGALVLWTLKPLNLSAGLSVLTQASVQKIAVANPRTAPYGEAAMQVLQQAKLAGPLQTKLVFGESISQVNQYVLSGAVEAGFTAKSVVLDSSLVNKGHWLELKAGTYKPIAQAAVLIKKTGSAQVRPEARKFYDFLFSSSAQAIFRRYGYLSATPVTSRAHE